MKSFLGKLLTLEAILPLYLDLVVLLSQPFTSDAEFSLTAFTVALLLRAAAFDVVTT
jgi:hypothetical protein